MNGPSPLQVYCAGPFFGEFEKREMAAIAAVVAAAGYATFLPQRDGLEYGATVSALAAEGISSLHSEPALQRAIFALDVYQLLARSSAVVVNLNGRVPDEGTVAEAAMAWLMGKAVVLYQSDSRSVFCGYGNPIVTGLAQLRVVRQLDDLPEALEAALNKTAEETQASRLQDVLQLGEKVASARSDFALPADFARELVRFLPMS
jgi:nucleoside 2-deoxyribosyltransferase